MITIIEAMRDPDLWRPWFKSESWRPWHSFLKSLFAIPMSDAELSIYKQCTGRTQTPPDEITEAWVVVGRRGGKSLILALISCYLAIFKDWSPYLSPGEIGSVKVLAVDRKQAGIIYNYCKALLTEVPILAPLVVKADRDQIVLNNHITIEIQTASFRQARGFTNVAICCDETAFWFTDDTNGRASANPDSEIISAIRPSLSSIPGSMLLCASSPYARRGELWKHYRQFFGKDEPDILIWHAPTEIMNPSINRNVIKRAYERDPASAAAEYGAQFRSDLEDFVSREVVEAAIMRGIFELPPHRNIINYMAFVDPSGGSADSMTLAIAHCADYDTGQVIVDCVREIKPPFSPEAVAQDFCTTLHNYAVFSVTGDRFGGVFVSEQFEKRGISYEASEKNKSDLYREFLPMLNSGKVELLDNQNLINQLTSLERHTSRIGKDGIDHPPGGHDDVANAVAGAVVGCLQNDPLAVWQILGRQCQQEKEMLEIIRQAQFERNRNPRTEDPPNPPTTMWVGHAR